MMCRTITRSRVLYRVACWCPPASPPARAGAHAGTDVYKALALGARAVGIGRPSLYGLAAYGEAGARRVIDMLPEHVGAAPRDYLAER